ncbi:MAG: VWA domain-containing protein [Spirochaetaceae bacterium]|nr:MAG: VWA domain-containing protein [Spirochaetaceae bacterium]
MKKGLSSFLVLLLLLPLAGWSGGQGEAAASSVTGKYLAGKGIIIPSSHVHINSYVAHIDYNYPDPAEDLGVTLYSGHQQVSTGGQEELIQIGIQGRKLEFEALPPLNVAFVIDKSGSMDAADKMGWVKDAFDIFIEQVRDVDFVSLVVFDDAAKVVFPSTQMKSRDRRLQFKQAVDSVRPGGGTNLIAGLELGYQQVLANYRSEYTNRVLFLTDGRGESRGILDMAETYKQMGINVSTIGVGADFDLELMVELSRRGGGSSRFISDREEMEETFGSELDRMAVPVARDLSMTLEFLLPVEILGTWGYNNRIGGRMIHYTQETLHHRDYETILAQIRILPGVSAGIRELARFTIDYEDLEGNRHRSGPHILTVEFVDVEHPVAGLSSGLVLQSGTMLRFAQSLITIGDLYYSCQEQIDEINRRRDELWRANSAASYDELTNPALQALEDAVHAKMRRALDITVAMKKEMANARLRLDNEGFDDEIEIMDRYIDIIGSELEWEQPRITTMKGDLEMAPPVRARALQDHLVNLFREMTLELGRKQGGVVAVSGFTARTGRPSALVDLLNEMAMVEFGKIDVMTLVEREKLDLLLSEQELALSDLMDTENAIQFGKFLAAHYIVTGTVIETAATVVVFGRVIDVTTGEVESVAQVIIPKDAELIRLLS